MRHLRTFESYSISEAQVQSKKEVEEIVDKMTKKDLEVLKSLKADKAELKDLAEQIADEVKSVQAQSQKTNESKGQKLTEEEKQASRSKVRRILITFGLSTMAAAALAPFILTAITGVISYTACMAALGTLFGLVIPVATSIHAQKEYEDKEAKKRK
jgi:uncharacterized membrane protein